MTGRRRTLALLALLTAVGVIVAVVVSSGPPEGPAHPGDTRYSAAAVVQRRNLVVTDTESGTLRYAGSHTVYNRMSGTITWLPAAGRLIRPGDVLYRVDNRPVLLLDGLTPAYRTLKPSDGPGPDILELNADLVRLGDDPDGIVIDDQWQAATTAGVDALQYRWDERETGELTLGAVVFLPGPQLVSTVEGSVGGGVSLGDPSAPAEFVSLTSTTTTTTVTAPPSSTTPATSTTAPPASTTPVHRPGHHSAGRRSERRLRALLRRLQAEIAQLRRQPTRPRSGPPASGSPGSSTTPTTSSPHSSTPSHSSPGGGSATAILQTTSDHLIVTVDLSASAQAEAVVGERVTVQLPAGNTVPGRITAVSPVATAPAGSSNGGGSSSATVPVRITLTHSVHRLRLDQATVSVRFAQSHARHVLSVPVTALVATAGDRYAVQEAAAPHTLLPVRIGLFAAGYVQISGPGVDPGLKITDSQG